MTRSDWSSLISATAAAYIGLVFLRAAGHKLANFGSFQGFVADYWIVPPWSLPAIARGIVVAEASVTLALMVPAGRAFGGFLAGAMLLGYAATMATNLVHGRKRLECGCGGAPQLLSWALVIRNFALTGVAALVLLPEASALTISETAVALAGGFTLWVGFVVFEQILANASHAQWSLKDQTS
jgi:hypothetical protein